MRRLASALLLLLLLPCASAAWAEEIEMLRALKRNDPVRREMMETERDRLLALQEQVKARQRRGADAPRSTQLLLEARRLLNYTNHADPLARTISALPGSLTVHGQNF